jgi:hypothetical protein
MDIDKAPGEASTPGISCSCDVIQQEKVHVLVDFWTLVLKLSNKVAGEHGQSSVRLYLLSDLVFS